VLNKVPRREEASYAQLNTTQWRLWGVEG